MKKLLFLILISFVLVRPSEAQSSLFTGGYGHFFTGPFWFSPPELQDYLSSPGVLGSSLEWKDVGLGAGGEGFAEIRGLLIGGGGFGMLLPSMAADSGTAWVGFGAGYFKTGYVVHQSGRQFLSAMAGFGVGGIGTNIKNNSEVNSIGFDEQEPVPPGDERAYGIGYALFDVGLSYKVVASGARAEERGRYGGFMIGLDLGTWFGLRMDEWRYDGEATSRIPSPAHFFSPYIRLTIGGGSFRKHDDMRN